MLNLLFKFIIIFIVFLLIVYLFKFKYNLEKLFNVLINILYEVNKLLFCRYFFVMLIFFISLFK